MARCKDEIQANLLDLTRAAIEAAKAGDKALLKFLLEQGIGKAPVMPTATPDTEIKVVLGSIPRPQRVRERAEGDEGDTEEAGPDDAEAVVAELEGASEGVVEGEANPDEGVGDRPE